MVLCYNTIRKYASNKSLRHNFSYCSGYKEATVVQTMTNTAPDGPSVCCWSAVGYALPLCKTAVSHELCCHGLSASFYSH